MKYAAIVVLYNPTQAEIQNVNGLLMCFSLVCAVDNSDTSFAAQAGLARGVKYVKQHGNTGIATALNKGMRCAIGCGFNWAVTLDQDSCFRKSILDEYEIYLQQQDTHNLLCLAPQYQTDRHIARTKAPRYEEIRTTMQSGVLFNLEHWEKLGGFREDFFIDCVDYEYCYRGTRRGLCIVRCNRAVLQHSPAQTCRFGVGSLRFSYGIAPPQRYYYQSRNLYACLCEYKKAQPLMLLCMKLAKILFLFPQKRAYLKAFKQGLQDARRGKMHKYQKGENKCRQ